MSLFSELKRRNVFRVAVAYVVMSWLLLQVADVLLQAFAVPDWAFRLIFLVLAIGLVPVVIFAWAFELTPEGLKREEDVDRSASVTPDPDRTTLPRRAWRDGMAEMIRKATVDTLELYAELKLCAYENC